MHIDTYAVYSNTVNSVAFRGYGVPQLAWAYESQMDIMAERLGLDPWTYASKTCCGAAKYSPQAICR